jgi:hypothetical protein
MERALLAESSIDCPQPVLGAGLKLVFQADEFACGFVCQALLRRCRGPACCV